MKKSKIYEYLSLAGMYISFGFAFYLSGEKSPYWYYAEIIVIAFACMFFYFDKKNDKYT